MPKVKLCSLYLGGGLLLLTGMAQAAAVPSIADTSWDLTGNFSGKASVRCAIGGSRSVPIKSQTKLKGTINFDDGEIEGDGEGTFSWQDQSFSPVEVKGTWKQTGVKFSLEFENWYDSPMAAFASALSGGFAGGFSQGGVNATLKDLKPTKLTFSGAINAKGTVVTISESMGFKFDAAASALGSSNSCSYNFSNLGRKFTGKRPVQ